MAEVERGTVRTSGLRRCDRASARLLSRREIQMVEHRLPPPVIGAILESEPDWENAMNCAMCPAWMGGGMLIGSLVAILLVILLVVVILKLVRQ